VLSRPSNRRRGSHDKQIELNLVPILDTMVTLIGFLLFTTSFISIVSIESPAPVVSSQQQEEKLKERPLQLTVTFREEELEIWSPFEKIPARKIPHQAPSTPNLTALHEALLQIKREFPTETRVIFVPTPGMAYDTLIASMDSVRQVEATDPPIFAKNPVTGNDEAVKTLFGEIVFGNLLGEN
jgi:biopolymer transport protein TolR